MKKYKRLTTKEFNSIKVLLDNKTVSRKKIADVFGRAAGTIWVIEKYATLKEMRKASAENRRKYYKPSLQVTPETVEVLENPDAIVKDSFLSELMQIKSILLRIDTTLNLAIQNKGGERKIKFW